MKYKITRDYIDLGNSRSGETLGDVQFIVSHDTGNPGSTAYGNRNYFANSDPAASAHTFIDDQYILEIIPLSEKAWHVRYNTGTDNRLFKADANDHAIGVELCWGGNINFTQAYDRYVWYHAYLIDKYGVNPRADIVAHSTLDPSRRTDPQNALNRYGISWEEFLEDVNNAYRTYFTNEETSQPAARGGSLSLPLGEGDQGALVREIQTKLVKAGFSFPRYGADGIFGQETEMAVMRFQRKHGLRVDGLVGTQTLAKLNEVLTNSRPVNEFPLPGGILQEGDEGNGVRQLQRALKQINFDPGEVDGIFGPKTKDAVRRFQETYAELKNDGIYGPNTRKYILMELEEQS